MNTRVVAIKDAVEYDVTEAVKTMYDLLHSSMDWGSGFLSIEDVIEVTRLAEVCGFVGLDGANDQIDAYLRSREGHCPLCKGYGKFELGPVNPEGRVVRLYTNFGGADGHTKTYDIHEGLLVQPPNEPASLIWPAP